MASLFDDLPEFNDDRDEGERLRDEAFDLFRRHRAALVRHLQRVFVEYLLKHGPSSTDPLRHLVPLPPEIDPRVIGYVARSLSFDHGVTRRICSTKTARKVAHARHLEVWDVADAAQARGWLDHFPNYS